MIEGLQGSVNPFFKELHELRPFKGNSHVAAESEFLLEGLRNNAKDHIDANGFQGPPIRSAAFTQVHGASRMPAYI